jgi:hypothetical protein
MARALPVHPSARRVLPPTGVPNWSQLQRGPTHLARVSAQDAMCPASYPVPRPQRNLVPEPALAAYETPANDQQADRLSPLIHAQFVGPPS